MHSSIIMRIPPKYLDIFEKKSIANLATINPDGSPQNTPIWIAYDKEENRLIINTAKGRKKYRNMLGNPKVAFSIVDPENHYRYLAIQGQVSEVDDNPKTALEMIDKLSWHYFQKGWSGPESEERVTFKITLNHIHASG